MQVGLRVVIVAGGGAGYSQYSYCPPTVMPPPTLPPSHTSSHTHHPSAGS